MATHFRPLCARPETTTPGEWEPMPHVFSTSADPVAVVSILAAASPCERSEVVGGGFRCGLTLRILPPDSHSRAQRKTPPTHNPADP
jgi:hypothetical protein